MKTLASIGQSIEVTPLHDIQYWAEEGVLCEVVEEKLPFIFMVEGELRDDGFFYGLYGSVKSGPSMYLGLIANIMLRNDDSDWHKSSECWAGFKVAPSVVRRNMSYLSEDNHDFPFYLHPTGTTVDGYPRISRFAEVRVV